MVVLAVPIIRVIYEHGAFNSSDTINTAYTIAAFGFGVPAFILGKILMPIFYANQNPQIVMRITIYTIVTNIVLNVILMYPFKYVGIALGSSIAAWYNVYLFLKYAKKNQYFTMDSYLTSVIRKISIGGAIAALLMIGSYQIFSFLHEGVLLQIIQLFLALICGFGAYLWLMMHYKILDLTVLKGLMKK